MRGVNEGAAWRWLFQRVCLPFEVRSPDADVEAFRRGFGEAERFLQRLRESPTDLSPSGKVVVDFGCGYGSLAVVLARLGARQALGVDIDTMRLAYGQALVAEHAPDVAARVRLGTKLPVGEADLIVTKDVLEHVDDLPATLSALREALRPGGLLAAAIGPLWHSPRGGHIGYMTGFPWAHLIFPEPLVMAERRRRRPRVEGDVFASYVNKLPVGAYDEALRTSGLVQLWRRDNHGRGRSLAAARVLAHGPLREWLTVNVYGVWQRPG